MNEALRIFNIYNEALIKGDMETAFAILADTVVWHMGGEGPLSGKIVGKRALAERFAEFDSRSNGTFCVNSDWIAGNDNLVVASVLSQAEKGEFKLHNPGVDLYKIEQGKITEVWTFSKFQAQEDAFWGK